MTIEEMEAHAAYLKAFHRKLGQDMIDEATEELATERIPYLRELLVDHIEGVRALMARC
jgi:hypothetical protein